MPEDVKTEEKKPEPAPGGWSWGTFFAGVASVVVGGLIVESVRRRRLERELPPDEVGGW